MQQSQLLKEGEGAAKDPPFLEEEEKDEGKEEKEEKEEIDYARACGRLFPHVGLVYFLVPNLR